MRENINRKIRLKAFCDAITWYYQKISAPLPDELQTLIDEINQINQRYLTLKTMKEKYKQLEKLFESQKVPLYTEDEQVQQNQDDLYDETDDTTPLLPALKKPIMTKVPKLKVIESYYSSKKMYDDLKELAAKKESEYEERELYHFAGKSRSGSEMLEIKKHFEEEKYVSDLIPSTMWKWYQFACALDDAATAHYSVMARKTHPHIVAMRKKQVQDWARKNALPLPPAQINGGQMDFYELLKKEEFVNLGHYLPPAVATYRDGIKGNPFSSKHIKNGETLLIQQRSGLVVPMHMIQNKSPFIPDFIKQRLYAENYREVLEATKENILDQLKQAIVARGKETRSDKPEFPFLLQNLMNLGNEPEGVGAITEKILLQAVAELQEDLSHDTRRKELLNDMGIQNTDLKPTLAFSWQSVKTAGKVLGVLFSPLEFSWQYIKKIVPNSGVLFKAADAWLGQGKYKPLDFPQNAEAIKKPLKDYQLATYERKFPRATIIKAALEIYMFHLQGGGSSSSCKSGKDRRYAVKITADALAELYQIEGFSLSAEPNQLFTVNINGKEWRLTAFEALEMKVAELFIDKRGTLVSELNSPGAEGIKGLKDMLGSTICGHINTIAKDKKLPYSEDGNYVDHLKESSSFNKLNMGVAKKILKWLKGDLSSESDDLELKPISENLKKQIDVYVYKPSAILKKELENLEKKIQELKGDMEALDELIILNNTEQESLVNTIKTKLQDEIKELSNKYGELSKKHAALTAQEDTAYEEAKKTVNETHPDLTEEQLERKTHEEISRKKVDEILKTGLSSGKLVAAKNQLYEGAFPEGKEETAAREKFLAFLETRLHDPNCPTCKYASPYSNAKKAAASMNDLLGPQGLKYYKAAIEEETKSRAYRDAVFLAATQHVPGPKWTKRLVLWIAGPSAIGKSYATQMAIKSMKSIMEEGHSGNEGNYLVGIDGGVERSVSQMKMAVLQLASAKKYSGIRDLMSHTKLGIKSIVKKVANTVGLSMAIPDTFSNPLTRYIKTDSMNDFSAQQEVVQGFVSIAPDYMDESAEENVRACCKVQGESRAYASQSYDDISKIDLQGPFFEEESKAYNPKYFKSGLDGSHDAGNSFKAVKAEFSGDKNYFIAMPVNPVFIAFNPQSQNYEVVQSKGIRMEFADWERAQSAWQDVKLAWTQNDSAVPEQIAKHWLKNWIKDNVKTSDINPQPLQSANPGESIDDRINGLVQEGEKLFKEAIKFTSARNNTLFCDRLKTPLDLLRAEVGRIQHDAHSILKKNPNLKEDVRMLAAKIKAAQYLLEENSIHNAIRRAVASSKKQGFFNRLFGSKYKHLQKVVQILTEEFQKQQKLLPQDNEQNHALFDHARNELKKERQHLGTATDAPGRTTPTKAGEEVVAARVAEYLDYAKAYLNASEKRAPNESDTLDQALKINALIQTIQQSKLVHYSAIAPKPQLKQIEYAAISAIKARYGLDLFNIDIAKCPQHSQQAINELIKLTSDQLSSVLEQAKTEPKESESLRINRRQQLSSNPAMPQTLIINRTPSGTPSEQPKPDTPRVNRQKKPDVNPKY